MFADLIRHLLYARRFRGTLREKTSLWHALNRLAWGKRSVRRKGPVRLPLLGMTLHGHSSASLDHLIREIFLLDCYRFQASNDRPVIVDLGANVGLSVAYFKWLYPNARIIAFEPDPDSFKLLMNNISGNEWKEVTAHAIALLDHDGEVDFHTGRHPGGLLASIHAQRGGDRVRLVRAERLSNYLRELGHVDLVKMDVEGAEERIVRELVASETLRLADAYIIEYHHNLGGSPSRLSEFLRLFEEQGYDYTVRAEERDTGSFQDIVIHFRKQKG